MMLVTLRERNPLLYHKKILAPDSLISILDAKAPICMIDYELLDSTDIEAMSDKDLIIMIDMIDKKFVRLLRQISKRAKIVYFFTIPEYTARARIRINGFLGYFEKSIWDYVIDTIAKRYGPCQDNQELCRNVINILVRTKRYHVSTLHSILRADFDNILTLFEQLYTRPYNAESIANEIIDTIVLDHPYCDYLYYLQRIGKRVPSILEISNFIDKSIKALLGKVDLHTGEIKPVKINVTKTEFFAARVLRAFHPRAIEITDNNTIILKALF